MRWRRRRPKRRGYVRPSRATPKIGWSLRELAGLSGVAVRTIRMYLQRGVLPPPPFMGSATRYQRQHLVRLLAIRRLRVDEKLTLDAIRTRLAALSSEQLETLATANLPAGPLFAALGNVTAPPATARPVRPSISPHLPRWVRIELALGLELHVRNDASVEVIELARRLRETCSASIEREPEPAPAMQEPIPPV
jgi:DNA-binding transcriptional MerR regulator